MHTRRPEFSIIMPTYNSVQFVGEAINSVKRQEFKSWELLIVDDASTDKTPEMLRDHAGEDSRIKLFFMHSNEGPAKARNVAIDSAKGRFISFLDSDDIWREDKLERQRALFETTGTPLAFSAYRKIDESGNRIGRVVSVPECVSYRQLLGETSIATCTAAYDTERVGKVLMPDIRKRQDFALWLAILRTGHLARSVEEPLAYLRKRKGSVSSNKLIAAAYVWQVYRDLEKLSRAQSAYYFLKYAFHASVKTMA